jgi:hypothetical protein
MEPRARPNQIDEDTNQMIQRVVISKSLLG